MVRTHQQDVNSNDSSCDFLQGARAGSFVSLRGHGGDTAEQAAEALADGSQGVGARDPSEVQTGRVEARAPSARPLGVSDAEALELCREWMVYLGADDAVIATGPARELCHLYSTRYVGWVDNHLGNLGVDAIEWAAGLAATDGRLPVVFLSGGIRPAAMRRADALRMPILRYRPEDGAIEGATPLGRRLRRSGFDSAGIARPSA